jgi:hypothetical protein
MMTRVLLCSLRRVRSLRDPPLERSRLIAGEVDGVTYEDEAIAMRHAHHSGHACQQIDSLRQGLQQYVVGVRKAVPYSGNEMTMFLMRLRPGTPLAVNDCANDCGSSIARISLCPRLGWISQSANR